MNTPKRSKTDRAFDLLEEVTYRGIKALTVAHQGLCKTRTAFNAVKAQMEQAALLKLAELDTRPAPTPPPHNPVVQEDGIARDNAFSFLDRPNDEP